MADSRLDDELNVARIEFSDTPMWLQDLNDDPDGFPKKTALGTLWRGVDIETGEPDDSGQTELIRATRRGDLLYAEMLAEFGDTNVNIQDNKGRTALHWACAGGHALLVQLCLSVTTSDIGLRDEDGLTAFNIALEHDRSETIPNLFYRNMIELDEIDPQAALLRILTVTADPASTVDRPIFPGQAIFDPVHDQNLLLVSALVNRGVDLTTRDADGNTALHVAVAVGNVEIAVRLLEGGSEVNAVDFNGATPLRHAARTGLKMVEVLLDWKADTAAKDKDKKSVSDWALQSGQVDVARRIRDNELGVIDGLQVEHPALPLEDERNVAQGLAHTMEQRELEPVGVENREEKELPLEKPLGAPLGVENRELSLQDVGEPKDGRGSRSLYEACKLGDIATVRQQLKDGADVNERDKDRRSVLYLAAENGYIEIVQMLLAAGADIHAVDNRECTVLHMAACGGHTETVQVLIAAGVDLNAVNGSTFTSLHRAVHGGHTTTVQALVAAGADLNALDTWKKTVLHKAAGSGHTVIVQVLLAAGADPEAVDYWTLTVLHCAAGGGHTAAVQALLAAGADLHAVDQWKQTVLHHASHGGHTATVQALLAAGVSMHAVDNERSTALHNASRGGHTETVLALLAAGADIHVADKSKSSVLHCAARGGHTETVRALLAAGADENAVNEKKWTPLHLAARHGRTDTVTALLVSGAEIDKRGSGVTAVQLAKKYHHSETVGILVDAGAASEPSSLRDVLLDPMRRWS